jgi:hypothetical protein
MMMSVVISSSSSQLWVMWQEPNISFGEKDEKGVKRQASYT